MKKEDLVVLRHNGYTNEYVEVISITEAERFYGSKLEIDLERQVWKFNGDFRAFSQTMKYTSRYPEHRIVGVYNSSDISHLKRMLGVAVSISKGTSTYSTHSDGNL